MLRLLIEYKSQLLLNNSEHKNFKLSRRFQMKIIDGDNSSNGTKKDQHEQINSIWHSITFWTEKNINGTLQLRMITSFNGQKFVF